MISLKQIPELIQARIKGTEKAIPKHLLINTDLALDPDNPYTKENERKILDNLLLLAAQQIETDIPVLTISLGQKIDMFNEMVFHEFLDTELQPFLEKNKVRTTFLGKWYSLPGMIVEAIKRILNATGDFDSLFLNICINYNGQEEICDASKAILQKIQMDKEDSDSITIETIKENIYSSYFIPPSIIIEMGKVFSGTFLWDSKGAKILFLRKDFSEFVKADVVKAIEYYNKE